jgi:hypothetical protein
MKLSDIFDINMLFHPPIFYGGDWYLTRDVGNENDHFSQNARIVNGKNLYEEFLENNYYKEMENILKSSSLAHGLKPRILSTDSYIGTARGVYFSYAHLLSLYLQGRTSEEIEKIGSALKEATNVEALAQIVKEFLREDRKDYSDVSRDGNKSPKYEKIFSEYNTYIQNANFVTFKEYLSARINAITAIVFGMRYFNDFFQKEIDPAKLVNCFEYDKFCLCAAYSALDACYEMEEMQGLVDNCANYIYQYVDAIDRMKKINPNYSCTIVDKDKKLTTEDLIHKYYNLVSKHPEFKVFSLTDEQAKNITQTFSNVDIADFSSKGNSEAFISALEQFNLARELKTSWQIIPRGNREKSEIEKQQQITDSNIATPILEDEKIRRMAIGKYHLDNSQYLYALSGINEFAGYIGYIYPNGSVIFEKFYENEETKKIASSNATYVMNFKNFLELSKLTKNDIIKKIQQEGTANVKRIYHGKDMEKWKEKVNQSIQGNDYSNEVLKYIEALIGQELITKKGEQR